MLCRPVKPVREIRVSTDDHDLTTRKTHPVAGMAPSLLFTCYELADEFAFEFALPAVDVDRVEVAVCGRQVTVRGGDDPDPEYFGKTNRPRTAFRRVFMLPECVDADRARASESGGILAVRAPRRPAPSTRRLTIERAMNDIAPPGRARTE